MHQHWETSFGKVADVAGGILFKPLSALITALCTIVNQMLSLLLENNTANDLGSIGVDNFIGPEDIFKGDLGLLNANMFEEVDNSTAGKVKQTVAQIYVLLRNICAMIMLAGLIFTGIRILTTSNIPTKKMQYLMLLEDWIIGLVFLIFSHIVMILIFELTEALVGVFSAAMPMGSGLMEWIQNKQYASWTFTEELLYLILFAYLTWMIIVFTISYFKRFFWVAVLTIFAPVVSVMYAFGPQTKSIYSRWIREYITTALVQPFHMLVYYVLITIPIGVIDKESSLFTGIYALVAITFIRPAEKFLRELFGMDKGIAGAGSYDSGVAPIKAAAKAAVGVASIAMDAVAPGSGAALRAGLKGAESVGETVAEGDSAEPIAEGEGASAGDEENVQAQIQAMRDSTSGGAGQGSPTGGITPIGSNETGGTALGDNTSGDGYSLDGGSGSGSINASNVTINASNIDLNGQVSAGNLGQNAELASGESDSSGEGSSNGNETVDEQFEFGQEKKGRIGRIAKTAYGLLPHSLAISTLRAGNDMLTGRRSIVDTANAPLQWLGNTGLGKKFKGNRFGGAIANGYGKVRDIAKRFEEAGGIAEIYKGFQSVRDTMYIGGAPKDWQDTAGQMDSNLKKRQADATRGFVGNKKNMDFMLNDKDGPKLLAKMQSQYKGKPPEYQLAMAKAEAQKKLESMAKDYLKYGVTDVEVAYGLSEYAKNNSCLPEDAIRQVSVIGGKEIDFSKFNTNQHNIARLNVEYKLEGSAPVSARIPAASEYFSRGITNIEDMIKVDGISEKITKELGSKLSAQMSRDIATAVVKKGGIKYNGDNAEIRKMIEDITKKGKK